MTDNRCHRQKKMMGRGAEGGCGTEERPCPVSRVPAKIPTTNPEISKKPTTSVSVDFYTQARKALCERVPFDVADETSASASAAAVPTTLPGELARSLSKHSYSRKRHKKSHSGPEKKSSRPGEKSRGGNIWVETEEYFRDLTLGDIDTLSEVSSFCASTKRKCFLIPFLGNDHSYLGSGENFSGENANGVIVKEEENEDQQPLETDTVEAEVFPQEDRGCSVSDTSCGLEWLLGCRNKVSLTSERPSKKRKLLGCDAGLDKVLVTCPCEGNSSLCHFCSKGDAGRDSNRLIVCSSCKVAVHKKCYGVHEDIAESWLCSWCSKKDESNDSMTPCVLCPKQGGALKPVHKNVKKGGALDFAHLFCSQWMPEVYIEDLAQMEPIMNVEGISETRRKLVCNICKVKCGTCVRCSHGTCRSSFHPICAREARHRMEVWGKYGCDNVELRAFCSKHSEVQHSGTDPQLGSSEPFLNEGYAVNHLPVTLSMNRPQRLVIGRRNGDSAVHVETPDSSSNKSGDSELQDGLVDSESSFVDVSKCVGAQISTRTKASEKGVEDVNPSGSLKFAPILKKLIDRGKVSVEDVASQIGISPDTLMEKLAADNLVPDLGCKIVKWLKTHAYIGNLQKNLTVKIKPPGLSKDGVLAADVSDATPIPRSDNQEPVTVKSIPPRRRTKSNVRILNDSEIICSSEGTLDNNGMVMENINEDNPAAEELEFSSKESIPGGNEKNALDVKVLFQKENKQEVFFIAIQQSTEHDGLQASLTGPLNKCEDREHHVLSDANPIIPDLMKSGITPNLYIHPYIRNKLFQMQSGVPVGNSISEDKGSTEGEMSRLEASSNASVCCNHQGQHANCSDISRKSAGSNLEQLVKARSRGVLDLYPEDELEGQLIYFQSSLLGNAVASKQFADHLIHNVAKNLPKEIDAARSQRWDAVLVNQYLSELREAKKQGKKERRHKEAQAVLAAATAAAAASSRISSFRKDPFDESTYPENFLKSNSSNGRAGIGSHLMPRPKETLPKVALPKISVEKQSEFVPSFSDISKEHPRSCDICRRSETFLNPILVCSSCKVAVHLDCYRSVKGSSGPWLCELCEELSSSRTAGAPAVNFWEKSYFVAECGLCGGATGAFRKSSDGQWVHAFCAEWIFVSTFRRGQTNPVEGMQTVGKGVDVCFICRRSHGVCIKCSYGHCQSIFHPSCARSAGFYMNIKTSGGKLQYKAYCEKHSSEQKAKAENQTHGIEELKRIKQIRVELERLRLLCERIIRREKIKRDLVFCSHDMLAFKRDLAARAALARSVLLPEVSSESATTSLKGHTDDFKSYNEAIQRSDDTIVDSSVSSKHRRKISVSMDTDQKTDDCSTSQNLFSRKLTGRAQFSGKQIPHRPAASRDLVDDGGWRLKSRKAETFQKELVMTSDQASMKNSLLPKQYLYVPADILAKEKQNSKETGSGEPMERDG